MSTAAALIQQGEQAYAEGDRLAALVAFRKAAGHADADAAVRREALNDVAVVLCDLDRPAEAETALREAMAIGVDPATLENLARCLELLGRAGEGVALLERALALTPGDPSLHVALAGLRLAAKDPLGALDELATARALGAVEDELAAPEEACRAVVAEYAADRPGAGANARPRALLGVEYFYPSVGGSERLVEDIGTSLLAEGWEVDVVTRTLPGRRSLRYRGMTVHEVDDDAQAVHELCAKTRYDAVVPLAFPHTWPLLGMLTLPEPRPRVLMVPCVNEDAYRRAHQTPGFLEWYGAQLSATDGVGYVSRDGWDLRMLNEVGVEGVYMPNAVRRWEPAAGGFRERFGIDPETPLLVFVATLWGEKNHAGLLDLLRDRPGDWRLAVIGGPPSAPFEQDAAPALAAIAREPRVIHVPHADRHLVAAALSESDLLVHPSRADSGPLVILEAMSHGLPWLATPTCGAAREAAGGVVAPVEEFPGLIDALLADPAARAELGAAGEAHWRAAYSWDVMGPRYSAFLAGEALGSLQAPPEAVATSQAVAGRLQARLRSAA
jgi:glycosyltransferase involved in cell wall biosynthesis